MALAIADTLYAPELALKERKLGNFYRNHPTLSRAVCIPSAVLSGALKPFLFPVISAVGFVVFPIMALIRACQGRSADAKAYLKATAITFLGLGLTVAFAVITAYYVPLVICAALVAGVMAFSIAVHVHRAARDPLPLQDKPLSIV